MPRPVLQAARNAWVAGFRVRVLPDIANDEDALVELHRGYRALAEAVARIPVGEAALQIRLESLGAGVDGAEVGVVTCYLLVRARTEQLCDELAALTQTTLPAMLGVRVLDDAAEIERALLGPFCAAQSMAFTEVGRAVESVAPFFEMEARVDLDQAAIPRWSPVPEGLRHTCTLLARRTGPGVVALHMESMRPSSDVLDHLDWTIRDIASNQDVASSPLRAQIVAEYRSRLRDLPRAALQVRVVIAVPGRPSTTLAASVGLALARDGAFEVRGPAGEREEIAYHDLFGLLASVPPGGGALGELGVLCDTAEAAAIVRFPVPAPAGTPGLASAPVPVLPRAADPGGSQTADAVALGVGAGGGRVDVSISELRQHMVVAGLPGFGKTLTTQTVLAGIAGLGIPFLVIDPAKSDYRDLSAVVPELRVIALTPDDTGFNPFGVPEGCPRITHAGRVLAAFDAAFSLSSDWPAGYVTFARALHAAYAEEDTPTLRSLYSHVERVIARSRFAGPDGANLRASLLGRIEFLERGPLGLALSAGTDGRVDYGDLLSRPTVIELRAFAAPTERSLVFALILAGLISHREHHPVTRGLGHVAVLEEAHRLLRRSPRGAASEGVRLFVEAIAELRGSGQGFVVVDQAPTLLDEGVMKLAGTLVTHRLVEPEERTTMGAAMMLDAGQSLDLARLETGEAVVHSPSRRGSMVADVRPPQDLLRASMHDVEAIAAVGTRLPWRAAASCGVKATSERVAEMAGTRDVLAIFEELAREAVLEHDERRRVVDDLSRIAGEIRRFAAQRKGEPHE